VIAADEGVMPQTKEHIEILGLLGVKKGIVVITKKDLVDEEWLSMIKKDVEEEIKYSFLKDSPFVYVSSKTKEGVDELTKLIDIAVEESEERDKIGHFRLPVDRSFSVSGFGTIVTGTVLSGRININDELIIYPKEIKTKVRGIQIHGEKNEIAEAGQRCAINLANIKKDEVDRGDIVSIPDVMEPTYIVDGKLFYLKSAKTSLVNRQRVRFYAGTSEIMARIVILNKEEIKQGESGLVQIRLESMTSLQRGDKFIIRSYSPMYTIGGGVIIDPIAKKAKRFDDIYIEKLETKAEGSIEEIISHVIQGISEAMPNKETIVKASGRNIDNIEEILSELEMKNIIISLKQSGKTNYIHRKYFEKLKDKAEEILQDFHKKFPLEIGISKEELKIKLLSKEIKNKIYNEILNLLEEEKIVEIKSNLICLTGFTIKLTIEENFIKNDILKVYQESFYATPKFKAFVEEKQNPDKYKKVYELLLKTGDLVRISTDIVLTEKNYNEGKVQIINFIKENKKISLVQVREILNTSRQYSVAFLEHLDQLKITCRQENDRILLISS
jgi:selenocysteine-specific elongation factor